MFKKLKSIFIIEEEMADGKGHTGVDPKVEKKTVVESTIKIEKPQYSKENPPQGKVDEKFLNRLLRAIEEGNVEGFDYLEYKQALQNLSKLNMEESTRFQSTMAMAKTMGASPESLVKSAEHYLSVLEKEESKFLEAFRNQMARHVDANNNKLKSLELSIANKKRQIEQLQAEIVNEQKELEERKKSIEKSKVKVESTKNSFYHAYHIVAEQIKDDLEKMKKYLNI